jgi:site-specific DNA-methyltransferase (adenine-specific)
LVYAAWGYYSYNLFIYKKIMEINKVYHGKMEEVLKDFPDNYCHSIVTDPPYGLSFMNKHWDYDVPTVEQWKEAFRVLKPGGFMLCACGTRTQHRMVVNIEDAGFEIRDVITWHYGSGFPKSLDISKAIDKQAGAEREIIGDGKWNARKVNGSASNNSVGLTTQENFKETAPSTEAAKQWEGYGTALKPATEFWTLCRKPVEGTVAENVLKYGCGGLNIDGCRIEKQEGDRTEYGVNGICRKNNNTVFGKQSGIIEFDGKQGRFPANVILDEFMGAELDKQSIANGIHSAGSGRQKMVDSNYSASSYDFSGERQMNRYDDGDNVGASRFFYCPKPDRFEREKGLRGLEKKQVKHIATTGYTQHIGDNPNLPRANHHPTVKPIDLMRYLVRLVTPKGGICLDPFCGSGTTLIAAKMELMNYIGIDMDESHIPLAEARIKNWNPDLYKPQELF